jgi:hypothetical protein
MFLSNIYCKLSNRSKTTARYGLIALILLIVKSIYHSIGWSTRNPVNSTFDEVRAYWLDENCVVV